MTRPSVSSRPMMTPTTQPMRPRCVSAIRMEKRWYHFESQLKSSTDILDKIDSLAPINIAGVVLDCHREDEVQGHVEGYYRGCEARHEGLRWAKLIIVWRFQDALRKSISISRKKVRKHKYEGHSFISSETLPRCSVDGYYDKLQRDSEDGLRGFCSHK